MLLPPRNQHWPRTSGKTLTYPGIFPQVPSWGTTNTAASRSASWEEIHLCWHWPMSSSCFRGQLFGSRKALAKQKRDFTYRITSGTPNKVKEFHSDGTFRKVWIIQHKLANPVPSKCSALLFKISDVLWGAAAAPGSMFQSEQDQALRVSGVHFREISLSLRYTSWLS